MAGEYVEDSLYPSPSELEENLRWKYDGYESAQHCFESEYESDDLTENERLEILEMINKTVCGWEIMGFKSMEEACRHAYDTGSLEEAIWDSVGILRLIALNGDEKTVKKSGWKYLGNKPGKDYELGDRSVRLGSRIVFAIGGIYEEENQLSAQRRVYRFYVIMLIPVNTLSFCLKKLNCQFRVPHN